MPIPTLFESDGKLLTEADTILSHIVEYYKSISEDQDKPALTELDIQGISQDFVRKRNKGHHEQFRKVQSAMGREEQIDDNDPNFQPPTEEEIEEAIDLLKKNKSPGEDNIQAEAIMYAPPCLRNLIYKIIKLMWEHSVTPSSYTRNTIGMT